jgi:hypothetical protein
MLALVPLSDSSKSFSNFGEWVDRQGMRIWVLDNLLDRFRLHMLQQLVILYIFGCARVD